MPDILGTFFSNTANRTDPQLESIQLQEIVKNENYQDTRESCSRFDYLWKELFDRDKRVRRLGRRLKTKNGRGKSKIFRKGSLQSKKLEFAAHQSSTESLARQALHSAVSSVQQLPQESNLTCFRRAESELRKVPLLKKVLL